MIKRVRFVTGAGAGSGPGAGAGVGDRAPARVGEDFAARWHAAVAEALTAPPQVRPVRVAVCTVLPDVTPDPRCDGVGLEWFADEGHLTRYEQWLAAGAGKLVDDLLDGVVAPEGNVVLVAREHVMRGGEWLDRRWRDGGEQLKHMAIARRAVGLTAAEFSDRWRNRAGTVGAIVVPEAARGHAYVQNHPVPRPEGDWLYDALNEVYCGEAGLRARIAWFEQAMADDGEQDLVGQSWFVAAREELL